MNRLRDVSGRVHIVLSLSFPEDPDRENIFRVSKNYFQGTSLYLLNIFETTSPKCEPKFQELYCNLTTLSFRNSLDSSPPKTFNGYGCRNLVHRAGVNYLAVLETYDLFSKLIKARKVRSWKRTTSKIQIAVLIRSRQEKTTVAIFFERIRIR